jgi:hypothetical protein
MFAIFVGSIADVSKISRSNQGTLPSDRDGRAPVSSTTRPGMPKCEAAKFPESDHLDASERTHPFSFNRFVPSPA